ncbi:LysR family transcriptional regulator [Acidisoma silvae]|uniref:LysR family transcriptional regulator n=1 Tax=Acidisoma silvae TaxID=2802396 RepID=A0A964DXI8_9PROT|nr:LysR family transcriptional regulator [Acidisoma silvae]MCB8874097.1 LysR family transcriptional regulator [Acidisoma silvae]
MFELNQLRCFLAVAEELHFGRAAQRLNMTQPPLSRQIRILETAIDVKLLERTSRSVRLTSAGRSFMKEARQIIRLADSAVRSARLMSQGVSGTITVGFTQGSSYRFLPQLAYLARNDLPDVKITLNELPTAAQIEALRYNRIDLAIVQAPFDRTGMDVCRVIREPFILAAHADHPLATGPTPRLRYLTDQDLIMYAADSNPYLHGRVSEVLSRAEVAPRIVQYVGQTHTMVSLVGVGLGLAIVPYSTQKLRAQDVVFRNFEEEPETQAELHTAWLSDNDNPAFRHLRRLILERFAIL